MTTTPSEPQQPSTWADLERLALTNPYLHRCVSLVRSGICDREAALVCTAMLLASELEAATAREIERRRNEPTRGWKEQT